MRAIRNEIVIEASPDIVWSCILDVDSYPEWNPFTPWVSLSNGEVIEGAEFELDCQLTPTRRLEGEAEVILRVDVQRHALCMGSSRLRPHRGVQSARWQRCHAQAKGATYFVNEESFSGLLAPVVYLLYSRALQTVGDAYCSALKARCEAR